MKKIILTLIIFGLLIIYSFTPKKNIENENLSNLKCMDFKTITEKNDKNGSFLFNNYVKFNETEETIGPNTFEKTQTIITWEYKIAWIATPKDGDTNLENVLSLYH